MYGFSINTYVNGQLDWEGEDVFQTKQQAEEVAAREQSYMDARFPGKYEYRVVELTAADFEEVY